MSLKPVDWRDGEAVVAVLRALLPFWEERPAACLRTVRRALETFWDEPRATVQGHRKRAGSALWSPDALQLAKDIQAGVREASEWKTLVGEHVVPVKVQVEALRKAVEEGSPLEELLPLMEGTMAVITAEEDKLLRAAGLTSSMPTAMESLAPKWARYQAVGLEWEAFQAWPQEGLAPALPQDEDGGRGRSPRRAGLSSRGLLLHPGAV